VGARGGIAANRRIREDGDLTQRTLRKRAEGAEKRKAGARRGVAPTV